MWNWRRRQLEEKRREEERLRQEARERRDQKRLQYAIEVQQNNNAPVKRAKQEVIRQEKQQFDLDVAALMQLELLEEELAEAVQNRRDTMLRRIKEILDEQ